MAHMVVRRRLLVGLTLLVAAAAATSEPAVAQPPEVIVSPVGGDPLRGSLISLAADSVTVETADAGRQQLAIEAVRTIAVLPAATAAGSTLVGLIDGSRLAVREITATAETATTQLAEGRLSLPAERLHWIAWPAAEEAAAAPPETPAWLADLPAEPEGDIVVIRRDDGWQFIACAIIEVTAEQVVVLLEDERIPVTRSKLAGLCWLRGGLTPGADPEPAAGEILLDLAGTGFRCYGISWQAAERSWRLQLTADTAGPEASLPPGSLSGIDYAFGRRIDLTRRPAAETTVEPFYGSLADDEQLRAFFEPRVVVAAAADAAFRSLLVRPRTDLLWAIPSGSRVFRTTLRPAQPAAVTPTAVVIEVDGRECFRGRVGGSGNPAAAVPIEIDLTGGRQLRLLIDFVRQPLDDGPEPATASLLGGPVLLADPLIER